MRLFTTIYWILFAGFILCSCSKAPLSTVPTTRIILPNTAEVLNGLLNNDYLFSQTPVGGEQSADGYLLTDPSYTGFLPMDLNFYIWAADIYAGATITSDWTIPYQQIMVCNQVLENLSKINKNLDNQDLLARIKGKALFLRGHAFLQLVILYGPAYTSEHAKDDYGVPLPLSTDPNIVYSRATLKECYSQIISDLTTSASLLPVRGMDTVLTNPDKAAAFLLAARAYYLSGNYSIAEVQCDSAIYYGPPLVDFNKVAAGEKPQAKLSKEILYSTTLIAGNVLQVGVPACIIDTNLYKSYDSDDLRKTMYCKVISGNKASFKNCFIVGFLPFSGLTAAEAHLIRAECNIQLGNVANGLVDINLLLSNRYRTNRFVEYAGLTQKEALQLVWKEQQKELLWRGLRWAYLKHTNAVDGQITLQRTLYGQTYNLLPQNRRYQLPIPPGAFKGNNIVQNPR